MLEDKAGERWGVAGGEDGVLARVAQTMRRRTRQGRLVFDYLRMTENSCACPTWGFSVATG